jgi:hypothetical protein
MPNEPLPPTRSAARRFSNISEGMERHEFVRRRAEEMPPELRKLLARLGECAVAHLLRGAAGVVQRIVSLGL